MPSNPAVSVCPSWTLEEEAAISHLMSQGQTRIQAIRRMQPRVRAIERFSIEDLSGFEALDYIRFRQGRERGDGNPSLHLSFGRGYRVVGKAPFEAVTGHPIEEAENHISDKTRSAGLKYICRDAVTGAPHETDSESEYDAFVERVKNGSQPDMPAPASVLAASSSLRPEDSSVENKVDISKPKFQGSVKTNDIYTDAKGSGTSAHSDYEALNGRLGKPILWPSDAQRKRWERRAKKLESQASLLKKMAGPLSPKRYVTSGISYPSGPSETEVVFELLAILKAADLDVRAEVTAGDVGRLDLVIFNSEKQPVVIIEVKNGTQHWSAGQKEKYATFKLPLLLHNASVTTQDTLERVMVFVSQRVKD